MVEQRAHIPVGRTIDQPGHDDGDDEVAEGCRDRGQDRHRQQAKRPKGDEGAQVADAAEAMPQPGDGTKPSIRAAVIAKTRPAPDSADPVRGNARRAKAIGAAACGTPKVPYPICQRSTLIRVRDEPPSPGDDSAPESECVIRPRWPHE